MLFRFDIAGRRLPLYRRAGESFEHVMLKALCYALFVERYEGLGIETREFSTGKGTMRGLEMA